MITGFMATGFMATGFMATGFMATGFMATGFMATGFMELKGDGVFSPKKRIFLPGYPASLGLGEISFLHKRMDAIKTD